MVALSKRNAEKAGVADKATFAHADIFQSDFSSATVLTLFLLTDLNIKLRPTILDMKPGTRVVSNSFTMGDWTPEETAVVSEGCTSFCRAHFFVPAKVDGTWQLGQSQLTIEQKYQNFTGRLTTGNVVAPIANGKLSGEQVTFTAGGTEYAGRVSGSAMEGTAKSGGTEAKWQATRTR
jgi:hypothetical protein